MILTLSLILMGLAAVLTVIRLLRGPTSFDRLLASDVLAVISTAFIAVYSILGNTVFFMDVAIVTMILGFIGVVVIARFLQGVLK
jgi:multisubunit Na+/H+ antiporter MnhF subunit